MSNVLEVSGLNKSYNGFALKDIGFSLQEDCITGFIGVNGAGKTTTIRTILSLAHKNAGSIKFFGKDVSLHEREVKDRIGVVLDSNSFYEHLTINEMKSIVAPAYSRWDEKTFAEYMEKFNLNPKQKIKTLSKGMCVKFALALALSHNADLLIMDEPTSGLDPLVRSQLLEIMLDYMKQGGKSVFFSTHITSDLDKIADMLILIDKGEILFEKEKDILLESHRIVKGDINALDDTNRKLFLQLETNAFGFSGITNRHEDVLSAMPDVITERVTVEDIMLAYIGRD